MMENNHLEPGFIQVFRLYAWLRLLSLLVIPLVGLRLLFAGQSGEFPVEINPAEVQIAIGESAVLVEVQHGSFNLLPAVFMLASVGLLMVYLYWPWLKKRMGSAYALGAILLASAGLLVEQHLLAIFQNFLQLGSFFYIILILVAWQYNYRQVVAFTFGAAIFELLLHLIYPLPVMIVAPFPIQERLVYFSLFFRSMAFLVLGYVVTRLVQAQRQQRQALHAANQKLVRHAAALEQLTISRERVRLSRELHDILAHTLSALAVQIDAVSAAWDSIPEKARQMLDKMLQTTRTGLDETRRSLSALRASPLEEMGLALALRTLAEDFAARNALALELEMPENLDDLPEEIEQCFYRVAQEAFENIGRHAQATRLSVSLTQNGSDLDLRIVDDGAGFDPNKIENKNRLGIKGMRERSELAGAKLDILSKPGEGASVHLRREQMR